MKNKLLLIIFYLIGLYASAQNNPQWIEPLYLSHGADIASASTLTLGSDGNSFDVIGTTQIDSISSFGVVGSIVTLQFDGALTLVHSADIVLPGGANVTTAAGDVFVIEEYATGQWRCVSYALASGEAILGGVTINGTTNNGITTYNSGTGNLDVESNATYASNIFDIQIGNTTSDTYQLIRRTDNSQQILSGVNNDFQEGFTEAATVTGQSNSSTLPFILGGRSNVDTGTTPITAFNSAYTGGTLTTRPAFGFYSEGTLLREIAADGTGDYQDNEALNIAGLSIVGVSSQPLIRTNTSDASDNESLFLSGGGDLNTTRGAYIELNGNEVVANGGDVDIRAGDGNSGLVRIYGGDDTTSDIVVQADGEVDIANADINGGTIDNTVIGGTTPAAGSFLNTLVVSGAVDDNTAITTRPTMRIRETTNASGWDAEPWAVVDFFSDDASIGAGVKGRIGAYFTTGGGGATGLKFYTTNSSLLDVLALTINSAGDATFSGNILDNGTNTFGETGNRWTNIYTTNQTTTNAETVDSDERLKKNIDTLSNATGKINQLRAVKYHWKDSVGRGNGKHFGFVAQEVEEVFPEIVTTSIDSLGNETKGIRYTELIPFLIRAVQEQQLKISQMEAKIEELENQ